VNKDEMIEALIWAIIIGSIFFFYLGEQVGHIHERHQAEHRKL